MIRMIVFCFVKSWKNWMLCEEWKWFCRILYVLVREIEKKLLGNGLEAVWKRFGNGFSWFSKSLDWVGFMIRECDEVVYMMIYTYELTHFNHNQKACCK